MRPKIAIIFTSEGIDTITVLSPGSEARKAGYDFCSLLEEELQAFESAIIRKIQLMRLGEVYEDEKC